MSRHIESLQIKETSIIFLKLPWQWNNVHILSLIFETIWLKFNVYVNYLHKSLAAPSREQDLCTNPLVNSRPLGDMVSSWFNSQQSYANFPGLSQCTTAQRVSNIRSLLNDYFDEVISLPASVNCSCRHNYC